MTGFPFNQLLMLNLIWLFSVGMFPGRNIHFLLHVTDCSAIIIETLLPNLKHELITAEQNGVLPMAGFLNRLINLIKSHKKIKIEYEWICEQ